MWCCSCKVCSIPCQSLATLKIRLYMFNTRSRGSRAGTLIVLGVVMLVHSVEVKVMTNTSLTQERMARASRKGKCTHPKTSNAQESHISAQPSNRGVKHEGVEHLPKTCSGSINQGSYDILPPLDFLHPSRLLRLPI